MSDASPNDDDRPVYPPGHQPYDALNGLRVGALAGALLGVILTLLTSGGAAMLILLGALAGAIAGYAWERSRSSGR